MKNFRIFQICLTAVALVGLSLPVVASSDLGDVNDQYRSGGDKKMILLAKRRKRRKPAKPKESILMPRKDYEALLKKKRKPSGIYYETVKSKR